jgi:hypothetical protein
LNRILPSSALLCVVRKFETDLSGPPGGSNFKGQVIKQICAFASVLKIGLRSLKFLVEQAMKAQNGSRGNSSTLSLTLALVGGGWLTPRPTRAALLAGSRPGTHFIGGWVGPRAGLDGCRKSHPDRPARSESLYRLSYRCLL